MSGPARRAGRVAAVVVRNDLTRDNRMLKMAAALAGDGRRTLAVGILTSRAQPRREETAFGAILRIATTRRFAAERTDAVGPAPAGTPHGRATALGSLRDFAGRIKDDVLLFRTVLALRPEVAVVADADCAVTAWLLQRVAKVPVIYDAGEVWVEQDPGAHRLYKYLYSAAERCAFRSASAVVTINEMVAGELKRRYGHRDVTVVFNGASGCLAGAPEPHAPVRFFFQGAFAADRDLDILIRAMPTLRGVATLGLQGFGGVEADLRALVRDMDLDDVVAFVPPCAPTEVVEACTDYDVGLITYRGTSLNLLLSSPNKLFDYVGGGLALAVSDLPFLAAFAGRYGCGAVVDSSSPEALGRDLARLARDHDSLRGMKEGARAACADTCWPVQRTKLAKVADAVARGRSR
jgi:glycosyltransferase involved in cell wall biosynthesis